MGTIKVWLRHENDDVGSGVFLCEWPILEVDALIKSLREWGLFDLEEGEAVSPDQFSGQFVAADECHFEIVYGGQA